MNSLLTDYTILKRALQLIIDECGQVCEDFELCKHPACQSSCGAWLIARNAMDQIMGYEVPDEAN